MALIKLNNQSYTSGSAFFPTDSIVQSKYYVVTSTQITTTSTSFVNAGSSFNFTPLLSSSTLAVIVTTDMRHDGGSDGCQIELHKDGSNIVGGSSNNWLKYFAGATLNGHQTTSFFLKIANSSTSQITFQLKFKSFDAGTVGIGGFGNTDVLIHEIKS